MSRAVATPRHQQRNSTASTHSHKPAAHRRRVPPPVSDTELLARYDDLLVSNSRNIARSYSFSQEYIEDIFQAVRLKLCLVEQQHRQNDGYLKSTIYNAQRDQICILKRRYTGLMSITADDDEDTRWAIQEKDLPATPPDAKEVLDRHTVAQRLFSRLSAEQQLVMAVKLGLDGADEIDSIRSISRKTGIAESRVPGLIRFVNDKCGVLAPMM